MIRQLQSYKIAGIAIFPGKEHKGVITDKGNHFQKHICAAILHQHPFLVFSHFVLLCCVVSWRRLTGVKTPVTSSVTLFSMVVFQPLAHNASHLSPCWTLLQYSISCSLKKCQYPNNWVTLYPLFWHSLHPSFPPLHPSLLPSLSLCLTAHGGVRKILVL